jgi:hypothetical protein
LPRWLARSDSTEDVEIAAAELRAFIAEIDAA